MGISSDAILFYGIAYDEEIDISEDVYDITDDAIDIADHCCDECRIPYIFIEESRIIASRGNPSEIDFNKLLSLEKENKVRWDKAIKEFCEKAGLEHKQPGWFMVSWTDAF